MILKGLSTLLPLVCGVPARRRRLSVLIYHRVLPEKDFMRVGETDALTFDWHMQLISRYFNPLPLHSALELMDEGQLPAGSICVTFDDGYADNAEVALPILRKWQVPATFFIATGFLNGGRMWNDTVLETLKTVDEPTLDLTEIGLGVLPISSNSKRYSSALNILTAIKHMSFEKRMEATEYIASFATDLTENLMMTTEQILELASAGMELGGHTVNHPILAKLPDNQARDEIEQGKIMLESLLGKSIRYFAYPNGKPGGDYTDIHASMLSELGFEAGVSTQWGVANRETDVWQIPRFTPWDSTPASFFLRLIRNYTNVQ